MVPNEEFNFQLYILDLQGFIKDNTPSPKVSFSTFTSRFMMYIKFMNH